MESESEQKAKKFHLGTHAKRVLDIAWPSVLESFFVAFIGMIDSLMVSTIGDHAVAAVGLTTQPKFVGLCFFIALNVAVSALVARRKGEQKKREANEVLYMALLIGIIATIIISVICVVFADPIIRLCGSASDTHKEAVAYFRIIMGGIIFTILSWIINSALRGSGNTKITLRTNVCANLVNVVFNYLLIGGHFGFPKLGVSGAAIATVIGTVVGCSMSIFSLFKRTSFVSLPYIFTEKIRPTMAPVKNMMKVSSSVLVEQLLMRIGFMATAVMAADQGTQAFAAHQVGMNILTLSFAFGDGMQVAAVALIGQSLGEGKQDLAVLYGKLCRRTGLFISIVLAIIYLLGGRFLYGLFFKDVEIINMGVELLRFLIITVIFQISQVIYNGCLRAAGDVVYTAIASTVSVTFVRSIGSYVGAYVLGLGISGIWLGILLDQVSRFAFSSIRFRSGAWTRLKI